jgi:uncharacterized protein (TIGR00106 family)
MKPAIIIVTIMLMCISVAHVLRLIFQVEITVDGFIVPAWVSIFGFVVPLLLALMLWKESRKEFIKTKLRPLKIEKKKGNQ